MPARGPASQVPVPGLLGVPLPEHRGQGCASMPVRTLSDERATFVDDAPVVRSRVPLAGALHVFITQVESTPFFIGSGVPKLQPASVQSGPLVLTGGAADVGPILQLEPAQLSANRLIEPAGVAPPDTVDPPPPMYRLPQARFLSTALAAFFVLPQMSTTDLRVRRARTGRSPSRCRRASGSTRRR